MIPTSQEYQGPDASDGCDKEGFPGGCERAGHTPENCPGFQIGDTVRFAPRHIADGDIGVIVGLERWLDDNTTTVWDGVGSEPIYTGEFVTPNVERFLVRIQSHNPDTEGLTVGGLEGWRHRCLNHPHDYPFCVARDLELVSRPEIRVLNDSGCLGAALGLDRDSRSSCISDSAAGARKAIADIKAAACIPLRNAERPGSLKFFGREETATKVADKLEVGFRLWMSTLFGVIEAVVTSVDENSAVVQSGALKANLMRREDGWYDTQRLVNAESLHRATFVTFDQEVAGV
jgi:hypothetical protein